MNEKLIGFCVALFLLEQNFSQKKLKFEKGTALYIYQTQF